MSCLCTSVRLKNPNNHELHEGQCLWLIRPKQAKGLINTVSDKLISKAAEICPFLIMGLEAAMLGLETITHGQIQLEQGLTILYL